jgi:hypothetical protein
MHNTCISYEHIIRTGCRKMASSVRTTYLIEFREEFDAFASKAQSDLEKGTDKGIGKEKGSTKNDIQGRQR